MLDILEVAVVGHVLRRMCPVPCIVGAVVAVEHIVACVGKVLYRSFGLLHITAELLEVGLVRHCALAPVLGLGDNGVAQRNGKVIAAGSLYRLNYLNGEAVAIFKAATVLIGAVVHVGNGELVEQIALVDCVDLNAIDTGIHELLCGLCKCVDLVVDLLYGHRAGLDLLVPAVGGRRSGSGYVVKVCDRACDLAEKRVFKQHYHGFCDSHGAAHTCGQLDKQLRAGLVELLHVNFKILEHLVVLIQPATENGILDALHAGQDETHTVLRTVEQEICGLLVEVARLHPAEQRCAAHRALDDAVGDLHIADLPGREQGIVLLIHVLLLPLFDHYTINVSLYDIYGC